MKLTLTSVEYSAVGSSNPGADVCLEGWGGGN